ncbi:uncharacterized protein KLLA0_D07876g [Kluyveromyces lactis]|uniref:KLLA0D07876p n=1 Tax=Kluyveromyces lactis (strain ATCC 8585 / CBS 2359 / DSM 70799 / NBRC 1267 / NRRL Y-1140 / WM37) TaxID=284590 RepID=Q6CRM5_KLULA|nr:uncharacterized protein KLLA0_D07876g [Kluyveromyces lactis]CAH00510.1 KLLA0D07876p [Kluyveromyces lactis]|eukprot:XP_453414.1 uncharacterized protein KLLA0_D07876g [Kluyveromyces lactis]
MSKPKNDLKCPQCQSNLQRCLIQQNYAVTICTNETCQYPFNSNEIINDLSFISDRDILRAAKSRLEDEQRK